MNVSRENLIPLDSVPALAPTVYLHSRNPQLSQVDRGLIGRYLKFLDVPGIYFSPKDIMNPRPGRHVIATERLSRIENSDSYLLLEGLTNDDYMPKFLDTRDRSIRHLERISRTVRNDPNYRRYRYDFLKLHEETHYIQQVRYDMDIYAETQAYFCSLRAVNTLPQQFLADSAITTLLYLHSIFRAVAEPGLSGLCDAVISGETLDYSYELAFLILLTGNPDLVKDIGAGRITAKTLQGQVLRRFDLLLTDPVTFRHEFDNQKFFLAIDHNLHESVCQLSRLGFT